MLRTLLDDFFRCHSNLLAFLKNENILESYSFAVSFCESSNICEDVFLPQFFELVKKLQDIVSQYNLVKSVKEPLETVQHLSSKQSLHNSQDTLKWVHEIKASGASTGLVKSSLIEDDVYFTSSRDSEELERSKPLNSDNECTIGDSLAEEKIISLSKDAADTPYTTANNLKSPIKITRSADGSFLCLSCSKSFSCKSSALRHHRSHAESKPFTCPSSSCEKRFASKTSLEAHQLRQHNLNSDSALACSHCGKQFIRRSALDVHMKIHSAQKPFRCDLCGRAFTQKVSLDIHLAKHTGKFDYECSICRKAFASRAKLNSHTYVHQTPRFTCELCGRQFVRRDSLLVHKRALHSVDNRPYVCCICEKTFASRTSLRLHSEVHNSGREYRCSECGAQFEDRGGLSGLLSHLRIQHRVFLKETKPKTSKEIKEAKETRAFLCTCCGRTFQKKQSLLEHEQIHSLSKPVKHICHLCPRKFSQKGKLSAHIRTHLEEPSHECKLCGKRFHRKDVHEKHMQTKHSHQRPFSCLQCNKAFASKSSLASHMTASHSSLGSGHYPNKFLCTDCGKNFKHKNTFTLHRKTHSGLFNYTCPSCGKKFMKKDHFEGHCRSHASERPFECPSCGKRYKERKHCREHIRKVHPATCSLTKLIETAVANEDAPVDELLCCLPTEAQQPSIPASVSTSAPSPTSADYLFSHHNLLPLHPPQTHGPLEHSSLPLSSHTHESEIAFENRVS